MTQESLKVISLDISEETYRADPALSYSILSKYERGGFSSLSTLFDRTESSSFLFGSALDTYLTEGLEVFNRKYYVGEPHKLAPAQVEIINTIFKLDPKYREDFSTVEDDLITTAATNAKFQANWKKETIIDNIRKTAENYVNFLNLTEGKTFITEDLYKQVVQSAECLTTYPATSTYFAPINPFESNLENLNQLKFKTKLGNNIYKCMADKIICDHVNKTITPIDLKTTSKPEWDFYKSFVDYRYDIQARLYWRIIRNLMDAHPSFKDYTLKNYIFIVINKDNLVPLVWEFPETNSKGTLSFGQHAQIKLRDPEEIGNELTTYLCMAAKVPNNIQEIESNNISNFLNTL